MDGKLSIVALDVNNVKRISAVHIEPNGAVVVLGGNNGAGKSSVLDAIMYALAGGKTVAGVPLRSGEKRGSVSVDLGDVVVTRTFTENGGGALTVEAKVNDGRAVVKSPQAWLDARIGSLSFDPLSFMNMKADRQAEVLRDLVGVDTSEIEAERARIFAERTDVNREVRDAEGALLAARQYPDVGTEIQTTSELTAELEYVRGVAKAKVDALKAIDDEQADIERTAKSLDDWKTVSRFKVESLTDDVKAAEQRLADALAEVELAKTAINEANAALTANRNELNEELARRRKSIEDRRAAIMARRTEVDAMVGGDVDGVLARFATLNETNSRIQANRDYAAKVAAKNAAKAKSDTLTAKINELDDLRQQTIAAATFPIDGLSFDTNGCVVYNGVPLDQASQAEKIRVSMAIALASNPALKVVLIRDGSLLDESNMKLIADMATAADAQVWIERVGQKDEGAIIIEDGSIKEVK